MCDCSCKLDPKNTPAIFGWVVVYELAIIIMILLFIYLDLDNTENTVKTDNLTEQIVEQTVE
ncbi:MAG: hypothetical protein APF84_15200 [Gracilibacter sp. BRH_c7a]|nr:MAG: hypothetical protein APF84_15200 [Gracilibacter sp. BRH_c7a]